MAGAVGGPMVVGGATGNVSTATGGGGLLVSAPPGALVVGALAGVQGGSDTEVQAIKRVTSAGGRSMASLRL